MWILFTVTNDIAGKKRYGAVTRADALNRSFTVNTLDNKGLKYKIFGKFKI